MRDTGAVAAVDCGTNSTRLLVVAPDGTVLERAMRITRLGEGVDAIGRLSSAAIERTLSVLRSYRQSMDEHAVQRVRVVATSAVRDARNAEEFMAPAEEITRVRPEILSGEEEGRLSFVERPPASRRTWSDGVRSWWWTSAAAPPSSWSGATRRRAWPRAPRWRSGPWTSGVSG